MRLMASGRDQAVQGTLHWHVPSEGCLKEIAENLRAERDLVVDEPDGLRETSARPTGSAG
jgi:hypothetical protein